VTGLLNLFLYQLYIIGIVALFVGFAKLQVMFRARSMRALAAKLGFKYLGPPSIGVGIPPFRDRNMRRSLPASFPLNWWPGKDIRYVFDVIEGEKKGVPILIFDSYLFRGQCTVIACQTEDNPFGKKAGADYIAQHDGWTILYRIPYVINPLAASTMSTWLIEQVVTELWKEDVRRD